LISLVLQRAHAPIEFEETHSEYHIIVPLSGIEARNVYVFAMPHSVLIEIRFKDITLHKGIETSVTEETNQRIERELILPAEIEQGKTKIRMHAGSLCITARKAQEGQGTGWSQLVHFDTRALRAAV
jgi:HSP20 family molecular chaperone IbpA